MLLIIDTSERAKSQFTRMSFIPPKCFKFEDFSNCCFSQCPKYQYLSLITTFYLYCHFLGMSQDVARLDENFACLSLLWIYNLHPLHKRFLKGSLGSNIILKLRMRYAHMMMTLVIMQEFSSTICH